MGGTLGRSGPTPHVSANSDGQGNQLLTIDTGNMAIVAADNLNGCSGAHGVAMDTTARRAYVACEANATLVVQDLAQHRGGVPRPHTSRPRTLPPRPGSAHHCRRSRAAPR